MESAVANLSQLKKALQKGARFRVLNHHKPHLAGQLREVRSVKTIGIYTFNPEDKNSDLSTCNGGKGTWMDYGPATHYIFGDTIKWFKKPIGSEDNTLIMEFKIIA